ncbi:putative membrane protein [Escherichia coli 2-316-03_S1_C2]|nr:hypothetical protein [Escherichia coli]KDA70786.1 putative membrane protein [Escherichia coli 2-005-03_S3_C2]KEJ35579.1 putative membrane protein [Escherichia coli 2-316-03_S1_C2]KEJ37148.1 putative membrane protein [Escherichia coli 2-316-03_S1_C1]
MLQIVGALILLIAGFAILRLLFRALTSTASALAGFVLLLRIFMKGDHSITSIEIG